MYNATKVINLANDEHSRRRAVVLHLAGSLCLTDAFGNDFTPRSRKAQGLLALIGTSPGLRRSRIWLQDKLWSDGGPEQGAACLRQCLLRIRRELGEHADFLKMEKGWIAFDPELVSVLTDPSAPKLGEEIEFLEGLDVGDPEFEDWLRDQRMLFSERWTQGAGNLLGKDTGGSHPVSSQHPGHRAPFDRANRSQFGCAAHQYVSLDAEDARSDAVAGLVARSLIQGAVGLDSTDEPAIRTFGDSATELDAFSYEQRQEIAFVALKALCTLLKLRDVDFFTSGRKPGAVRLQSPRLRAQSSGNPSFRYPRVA